jgi:hypothetical protein
MPREEGRERLRLLKCTAQETNVYRWVGRMIMEGERTRQRQALRSAATAGMFERDAA